jgi:energy-coupling factor transport system substrate-specific component
MNKPTMPARKIVLAALMGALLVAVKEPLAAVPVEFVSLLIVLYTLELPSLAPWAITVYIGLELILYGLGLWVWMYFYIWYLLYFLVRLFHRQTHPLFWAVLSGAYGLCFGLLCTPVYFLTQGPGGAVAWWINGIPTDISHCIGNFAMMLLLYRPLRRALAAVKKRSPDM